MLLEVDRQELVKVAGALVETLENVVQRCLYPFGEKLEVLLKLVSLAFLSRLKVGPLEPGQRDLFLRLVVLRTEDGGVFYLAES